jgi:hypothetical protein
VIATTTKEHRRSKLGRWMTESATVKLDASLRATAQRRIEEQPEATALIEAMALKLI